MRRLISWAALVSASIFTSCQHVDAPAPIFPVPTQTQIAWNEMERNAFIHFGLNTFNDMEWGFGDTPASTFDPETLDVDQWCDIIKKAGLKGVILTAKHHDGFCLWPSAYTDYSVKNSPWRNGEGDLVKELSEACKKYGLKFGIYLSPWDRNSAIYGTPEYITYFRDQLTELLTNYGDIFEVWLDGANGGTGYYGGANEERSVDRKTYYDWPTTIELIRKLQPEALIFSDAGPDVRWCGNESGIGGETNWSTLRRDEAWPGWPRYQELNPGHEDGDYWVPAEINTSTRPGWFYHRSEDDKVKTLPSLMDYYYESVGRNGTGLLNFPVDRRGLIHEKDAENVIEWQKAIEVDFEHNLLLGVKNIEASTTRGNAGQFGPANVNDSNKDTYWATDDGVVSASLIFEFDKAITFNRFLVQEYITLGQRVKAFTLEIQNTQKEWEEVASETTIGYKRILRLPNLTTNKVRFTIQDAKASPTISNIEFYNAPQLITNPEIKRDRNGVVTIGSLNENLQLYYTLDGSEPSTESIKYKERFMMEKNATIKAIALDPESGRTSPVVKREFHLSPAKWTIINSTDEQSNYVLDGNRSTSWHLTGLQMPIDLIIDLGETLTLKGFRYLPDQGHEPKGIIFNYQFLASLDGKTWTLSSSGEFANINNSPIWQEKLFAPTAARFIKLSALSNTGNDKSAGYAELELITE